MHIPLQRTMSVEEAATDPSVQFQSAMSPVAEETATTPTLTHADIHLESRADYEPSVLFSRVVTTMADVIQLFQSFTELAANKALNPETRAEAECAIRRLLAAVLAPA